jgi:hypothetical protein
MDSHGLAAMSILHANRMDGEQRVLARNRAMKKRETDKGVTKK